MHVIIGFKHWNGVNNLLLLIFMTFSVRFVPILLFFIYFIFRISMFLSTCRKTNAHTHTLTRSVKKLIILNCTCHRYKEKKKYFFFFFSFSFFFGFDSVYGSCVDGGHRIAHVLKRQEKLIFWAILEIKEAIIAFQKKAKSALRINEINNYAAMWWTHTCRICKWDSWPPEFIRAFFIALCMGMRAAGSERHSFFFSWCALKNI